MDGIINGRCRRCGTVVRSQRAVCPCCGLDFAAPIEPAAAEPAAGEQTVSPAKRKVAAKAGVKMCAICMASVQEEQLVEEGGQKICPACADGMKNKAAKKPK